MRTIKEIEKDYKRAQRYLELKKDIKMLNVFQQGNIGIEIRIERTTDNKNSFTIKNSDRPAYTKVVNEAIQLIIDQLIAERKLLAEVLNI